MNQKIQFLKLEKVEKEEKIRSLERALAEEVISNEKIVEKTEKMVGSFNENYYNKSTLRKLIILLNIIVLVVSA